MIKGHTTIELRDVVTGEVKRYDDDNMITNATAKMIDFTMRHSMGTNPLDTYTSHWYNLMGGVALFDTALDENPDHFYVPAGARMVGCGGVEDANSYNNITPWGVYNAQESDLSQTDTKKMVWDFPTNHANDTIASVALTHRICGRRWGFGHTTFFNTQTRDISRIAVGEAMRSSRKGSLGQGYQSGYGTVGSSLALTDGTYLDFCIDADNDEKYMVKVCHDGISILKHKMSPEVFDVFRSSTAYQSFEEETHEETFAENYFYVFYNTDEKALYFWTSNLSVSSLTTASFDVYIHKYDMTSQTLTKNWKRLTLPAVTNLTYYHTQLVITDDSAYYLIWDTRTSPYTYRLQRRYFASGDIDTINFSNPVDYGFSGRNAYILNGRIYFQNAVSNVASGNTSYYTLVYDTLLKNVHYTNAWTERGSYNIESSTTRYVMTVPPIDNTQIVFGSMIPANNNSGSPIGLSDVVGFADYQYSTSNYFFNTRLNMWVPAHYLATKNNLATPVIKTAQQTMKLTYTITKEEE